MSKKSAAAAPPQEEEWEDVEEGEEGEEEEEDTTIANSDVVVKYKKAAGWANDALTHVVSLCKVGAKVLDLCIAGDETINAKVATAFKGADKGPAFPTCVSVNTCVCHNSPVAGEGPAADQVLALNDVVHIDLGVQVDGYSAVVAHTILITADGQIPADAVAPPKPEEGVPTPKTVGTAVNVIQAAYTALNTALRQFRPSMTVYDVTETLEQVAAHFGVNCVEGVLSHQMKRFIIDGSKVIVGKNVADHKVHSYNFEPQSVWTLDVVYTTGKGRLREKDQKTTVYKVALDGNYNTKLTAAAEVQHEIDNKFQTFPFTVRALETKRARLGLNEMLKHGNLVPYPVLFEKDGEYVAHFKVTLLVTATKIERITGIPMQKGGPAVAPFTEEKLIATSKTPMSFAPKKEAAAPAKA